jgi:ketose-bisphosphate aldolase
MPLVSMRQLLDHAAENGYGLPAFNVNNMEQVWAICEAASQIDAPVIMQASAGARKYAGEPFLRHQILAALEAYPHLPIVMHQDHGQSPAVCMGAIRSGFTSVMMDGSLEADGKTTALLRIQRRRLQGNVKFAHAIGVSVEAELGVLGSLETMKGDKEDGHGADGNMTREQLLTDPTRPPTSSSKPTATRWPSPSAPATAPTSSPRSRPATSSPSTASRKSTPASRTPTWSCTAPPACRRNCSPKSANSAAT